MQAYGKEKDGLAFDLGGFVEQHFDLPAEQDANLVSDTNQSAKEHCIRLWDVLTRTATEAKGTKIALPEKFIILGGRFREFLIWIATSRCSGCRHPAGWIL